MRRRTRPVWWAGALLATVLGQDLETGRDGVFRIARRVARDPVISTVDPDTRHGHKTQARGFDGYKGHAAIDPDTEIITATVVTPGNAGDAGVAEDLITDLLADTAGPEMAGDTRVERRCVYGDNAYGTGQFHDRLDQAGIADRCKTQAPTGGGCSTKPQVVLPSTRLSVRVLFARLSVTELWRVVRSLS